MQLKILATIPLDIAVLLSLASCSEVEGIIDLNIGGDAIASGEQSGLVAHSSVPTNAFTMVGSLATGQLSQHQIITLLHLSWPQSYSAIEGALGRPHTRSAEADVYTLPNGNPVTIYYNTAGYASGYSLGDSN